MIALLKSDRFDRPVPISSSTPVAKKSSKPVAGWLKTPIEDGELFLEDKHGTTFRLIWHKDQKDRRRALAPGMYKVRGYRIEKHDGKVPWHISVVTLKSEKVSIQPGETVSLAIRSTILINCRAKHRKGKLLVSAGILGSPKGGLSIYCDGKKIPLRYKLVGADGSEVDSGAMRYG